MKHLLRTLALSIAAASLTLSAGDKKPVTYEGKITGVVCVSCKEHVAGALKQRLPDIISVDVKPGETPEAEEKKLIIVAGDGGITKEAAIEALGTYAKNYTITSLSRKD